MKMLWSYTVVCKYGNSVILNQVTQVQLSILQMILILLYAQMEDVFHTLVLILPHH